MRENSRVLAEQMKNPKGWREFQDLVARIEHAASSHDAVVTSPDRVRDLITGRTREVDASIRSRVGTTDVLVTVECRKRGRRDDDTWIESLATKRQKIGAAKTIAVSSAGFTSSAIKSARNFGIELRTLSKISIADIEGWFLPVGAVEHLFCLIEDVRCFVVLYEQSGQPSEYGFWAPDVTTPVLHYVKHGSPFAVTDYILLLKETHPELFPDVPLDGTKLELELPIHWDLGELSAETTDGMKSVHFMKIVATISYQCKVCNTEFGVHHQYASPDGTMIQHTALNTELFGLPVTFEHQCDSSGKRTLWCRFSPKLRGEASRRAQVDQPNKRRKKGTYRRA